MKAVTADPSGGLHYSEIAAPALPEGGALLRVTAVGICGSDLVKLGHTPAGTVLGHEVSGVITETAPGFTRFSPGDRVTTAHHVPCGKCVYCNGGNESQCRQFRETNLHPGGWAETIAVSGAHLNTVAFAIPDDMDDAVASLTEPLGCCVRAIRRSEVKPGEKIAVIGLGPVGMMLAALYRHAGAEVFVLDRIAKRMEEAAAWYGALPLPTEPSRLREAARSATAGFGFDQVVLAAGAGPTLTLALDLVRRGGKVHLFSGTPEGELTSFDLNAIYKREVTLFSTYSSSPRDLAVAFDLIATRKIACENLISKRLPLSRIEEGIRAIRSGDAYKVVLEPARS